MSNKIDIRISGLGGQGVVLAGKILGTAAVYEGKSVVQTQSYGAEARGTTAKSEVIISDRKINFPAVRKCDILIVMSQEAAEKNVNDLKENGLLLVNSSNIENVPETKAKIFKIPATETAEKFCGKKIYATMIMLGAFTKITNIVRKKSMERAIKNIMPEKTVATNIKAYKKGEELISPSEAS